MLQINAKLEAKESSVGRKEFGIDREEFGIDGELVLKIILVENMELEDFEMSMVGGIPTYKPTRIVMSRLVGTYVLTRTDTSLALCGKAKLICDLQYGPITQLLLEHFDGTIF